jgi:subfamily B ATP-binding cassette protein MsbA
MLIPFLDLIFLKKEDEYQRFFEMGPVGFEISDEFIVQNFNYYLSKVIVESPDLDSGKLNALVFLCVIIGLLFFFKNLFGYLALYSMAKVRNGILRELRESTYKKLLVLPISYYSDEKKGDIISKLSNDVLEIEYSVLLGIEMVFREPLSILIFLGTMLYMSPSLTIFVFILLPVTGLVIGKLGNSLRKNSVEGQNLAGQIIATLEETLGGLRIIKAFNAESFMNQKFKTINSNYFKTMVKIYRKRDLTSPLSEFLAIIILNLILWFGGKIVLQGDLSASVFIAFALLFSQIITPAKALSKAWSNVQKAAASANRIGEIVNAPIKIKDKTNPIDIKSFEKELEFKNLYFKYNQDYVLKNINLKIKKGEMVALVGESGGGKSTLADLIPRFQDVTKGEVLIDGNNVKDLSLSSLRNQLGVVTQQSILFNDTVFNNIAFGATNPNEEDVIKAAKIANAHDFIMELPNGYETNIGDGGGKLSGGQKQRLSIARAVLKNPPILILDEATSALDTQSEKLVQDALNKLMKNRTSLVIAHRLSTIQQADKIVVLEKGEILEIGTHQELLEKKGAYYTLYQLQSFD